MNDTIQILELFGGIGSPRCALRNLNIPTKAIDYVEINEKAVRSYNSMFREELEYKTQTVVGWNLKPDILIHGSPCQDMSIAGHQGKATGDGRINRGKGSDEGSGTRSSLMWETIHIIENMGEWRPRYVIWENVKNVKSKYMRPNFDRYMVEMEKLGYTNNYAVLDAREFGLPQARERVFTVSVLNGEKFEFDLELAEQIDAATSERASKRYSRQEIEAMMLFICKAYGNQFTVDELKDAESGLDAAGIVIEFNMIDMGIAEEMNKRMDKMMKNFQSGK